MMFWPTLALLATAHAQVPTQRAELSQLQLEVVSGQDSFLLHEPAFATATFTNQGTEPVTVMIQWHTRNELGRPDSFQVTGVDSQGQALPEVGELMSFGGRIGPTTLSSGESTSGTLILPHWVSFQAPGTHHLSVNAQIYEGQDMQTQLPFGASFDVVVVPDDAKTMAASLERTASAWAEGDGTARTRMLAWRDPMVVPHLIDALDEPSQRSTALHALGKWPRADAVQAIAQYKRFGLDGQAIDLNATEQMLKPAAASMRHSVAAALAENTHPSAWTELQTMADDPTMAVRLTVLHQAAKREDGGPWIDEYLSDPDATIRKEAQRYRSERDQAQQRSIKVATP